MSLPTNALVAEARAELCEVEQVDDTVSVAVQVVQVAGATRGFAEGCAECGEVEEIDQVVSVMVAVLAEKQVARLFTEMDVAVQRRVPGLRGDAGRQYGELVVTAGQSVSVKVALDYRGSWIERQYGGRLAARDGGLHRQTCDLLAAGDIGQRERRWGRADGRVEDDRDRGHR